MTFIGSERLQSGNLLCEFGLIVRDDAVISSHSHYKAFAIGGTLTDASPSASGTVGGHSYVGRSANGFHRFSFAGGVTVGQPLPFDWQALEYLAMTLQHNAEHSWGVHIHVICSGGHYDLARLYGSSDVNGRAGHNTLLVFNTAQSVTIGGTTDGRQFSASVLAPFAHVEVLGTTGYVDGFIIARSFSMKRAANGVQLHGRCFAHAIVCGRKNYCSDTGGSATCADKASTRKCLKKYRKGKCKKRRIRTRKCRATCKDC